VILFAFFSAAFLNLLFCTMGQAFGPMATAASALYHIPLMPVCLIFVFLTLYRTNSMDLLCYEVYLVFGSFLDGESGSEMAF